MLQQPLTCDSSFMLPTCFPHSPNRSPKKALAQKVFLIFLYLRQNVIIQTRPNPNWSRLRGAVPPQETSVYTGHPGQGHAQNTVPDVFVKVQTPSCRSPGTVSRMAVFCWCSDSSNNNNNNKEVFLVLVLQTGALAQ